MDKSYEIEQHGKSFATVCRTDGYWSVTWMSKNKRLAKRKGEEFISGKRTDVRKHRTKSDEWHDIQTAMFKRDRFIEELKNG